MTGPCGPLVHSSRLYDGDSWLEPPSLLPDSLLFSLASDLIFTGVKIMSYRDHPSGRTGVRIAMILLCVIPEGVSARSSLLLRAERWVRLRQSHAGMSASPD